MTHSTTTLLNPTVGTICITVQMFSPACVFQFCMTLAIIMLKLYRLNWNSVVQYIWNQVGKTNKIWGIFRFFLKMFSSGWEDANFFGAGREWKTNSVFSHAFFLLLRWGKSIIIYFWLEKKSYLKIEWQSVQNKYAMLHIYNIYCCKFHI